MPKKKGANNTEKKVVEKKKSNYPKKKPYTFHNGRTSTMFSLKLYGDNAEYCRIMGIKHGFTGGPAGHYINYLIDKDRGYLQTKSSGKVVYTEKKEKEDNNE